MVEILGIGQSILYIRKIESMQLAKSLLFLALLAANTNCQFFRGIANLIFGGGNGGGGGGGGGGFNLFGGRTRGRFTDDGTQRPVASGRDELFPSDCGRNEDTGRGKLCFPDGLLCQKRE